MVQILPELVKDINLHIQETQQTPQKVNKVSKITPLKCRDCQKWRWDEQDSFISD